MSVSEARELGVGYFAFAQDKEQRQKQRETLDMLRDQVSILKKKKKDIQNRNECFSEFFSFSQRPQINAANESNLRRREKLCLRLD